MQKKIAAVHDLSGFWALLTDHCNPRFSCLRVSVLPGAYGCIISTHSISRYIYSGYDR